MRSLLQSVAFAAVVGAATGLSCLPVTAGGDCRQKSIIQLKASSPGGYAIYKQVKEPGFFASWIDCSDVQYNLSTAVHESTHFITGETDAFPLVGGGKIVRPHEVSAFYPPYRIASRFKTDDLVSIYLRRGKASSSTDFLYLLDEFNAYSHDLAAATDLKDLRSDEQYVDHRDGLAAMMAFLAVYAETARRSEPATWSGLQEPGATRTIRTLYGRAEKVMAASCGIPNFGTNDKAYLKQVCANGPHSALGEILGRAPACPSACLEETPDQAQTGDEATISPTRFSPQDAYEPRHPFGVQVGAPRHRVQSQDKHVEERHDEDRVIEEQYVEERSDADR